MNEVSRNLIEARGLSRIYRRGSEEIHALREIDLTVECGAFTAFIGPSGSGKTTLINILGCLDNPSAGTLRIDGETVFDSGHPLSEAALTRLRRRRFGYIFQKFHLIPSLTVRENVLLPRTFYRQTGETPDVDHLLETLGLGARKDHRPGQLSGGEMQRVAVARALINRPQILLADEPTGNLDTQRSQEIGQILLDLNRTQGLTVLLVTHNPELARLAQRIIELRDGRIQG
jgi:ABC-type lipoprotein export system ATPase subunit